jgi:hypothetical protein
MLADRSPSTASIADAPGSFHGDLYATASIMIAAPLAVIAAVPEPSNRRRGGVLSTGGMKTAAALLLLLEVREVVLLPVLLLKALKQRP